MIEKKVTDNGITVIFDSIDNISTCSLGVFVRTGSKDELPDEDGISHVLEHMMFKGTEKRNYFEISEEVDYLGASINAHTSKEETVYYINSLSEYINKSSDILFDIVTNSLFSEKELEKEKDVIIEEIKMYEDMPDDLVFELNYRDAIKGNLGKNIIGTEESVKSFTSTKINQYYSERYTKDNIVIVISGKFDKQEIIDNIEKYFGKLKDNAIQKYATIPFEFNVGNSKHEKDIKQVNICITHKGLSYMDEKRFYFDIVSNIMGGSMSSRLFQEIREEKGLAYSVYTYSQAYKEGGVISTYIGTSKESYEKAVEITLKEFTKLRENGILTKELDKAKNKFLSKIAFSMENPRSRMSILGNYYLRNKVIFEVEEVKKEIMSLEENVINQFLKDKFTGNNITVLGNV
jgi:predicted Zn-dependent peptidase